MMEYVAIKDIHFNTHGLIPAVVQEAKSGAVLMVAYMNEESLKKTIETGKTWFYSRSRKKLWNKGEESGHFQTVRAIAVDCDADTLLVTVEQIGAACHTGNKTCFYRGLEGIEKTTFPVLCRYYRIYKMKYEKRENTQRKNPIRRTCSMKASIKSLRK